MEPSSQSSHRGKIRGLWVFAVVAVLGIAALARWLTKPLPPPVMTLSLVGFKVYPTNTYAVMSLSNLSATTVYFDPRGWEAVFLRGGEKLTNFGTGFTTLPSPIHQGSNEVFYVEIPTDTKKWRVEANFSFYKRHHWRFELAHWLDRNRVSSPLVWGPLNHFDPAWTQAIEPSERSGSSATDWLTNLPPAAVPSE